MRNYLHAVPPRKLTDENAILQEKLNWRGNSITIEQRHKFLQIIYVMMIVYVCCFVTTDER